MVVGKHDGENPYNFLSNMGFVEELFFSYLRSSYEQHHKYATTEEVVNYYKHSMGTVARGLYDHGAVSTKNERWKFIMSKFGCDNSPEYRVIFNYTNEEGFKESMTMGEGTTLVNYLHDLESE
tara:strand:+ start:727 stop:1095 length:369 start_codon:yes stop_codon:yes gene_type:complete